LSDASDFRNLPARSCKSQAPANPKGLIATVYARVSDRNNG